MRWVVETFATTLNFPYSVRITRRLDSVQWVPSFLSGLISPTSWHCWRPHWELASTLSPSQVLLVPPVLLLHHFVAPTQICTVSIQSAFSQLPSQAWGHEWQFWLRKSFLLANWGLKSTQAEVPLPDLPFRHQFLKPLLKKLIQNTSLWEPR